MDLFQITFLMIQRLMITRFKKQEHFSFLCQWMVQIKMFSWEKPMLKDFFNLKRKSLFANHDPAGVKLVIKVAVKVQSFEWT